MTLDFGLRIYAPKSPLILTPYSLLLTPYSLLPLPFPHLLDKLAK